MNKDKHLTFRITGIDYEFYRKQAIKRGLSVSDFIREALELLRKQWEKEDHE